MIKIENKERFLSKILIRNENDCWGWTGHKDRSLRPVYIQNGKKIFAKKIIVEMFIQENPQDEYASNCGNRGCINPEHLQIHSRKEHFEKLIDSSNINRYKEKCKNGHDFDEKNTMTRIVNGKDNRACRECHRNKSKVRMKYSYITKKIYDQLLELLKND